MPTFSRYAHTYSRIISVKNRDAAIDAMYVRALGKGRALRPSSFEFYCLTNKHLSKMAGAFIAAILLAVLYVFFYEAFRRPNSGGKSTVSK